MAHALDVPRSLPYAPDADLRVGLNLLYLTPGRVGGTEVYAGELMRAMTRFVPPERLTLFLRPCARHWGREELGAVRRVIMPGTDLHPAGRVLLEGAALAPLVARSGVHVLHSLGYHGPWWGRVPSVLTVHDANYADFLARTWRGRLLARAIPAAMAHATTIITGAHFAREALARWHPWAQARMMVIPHGPGSLRQAGGWRPNHEAPYLLAFGAVSANKNLPRLLDAWQAVNPTFPGWTLRIAGMVPDPLRSTLDEGCRVVFEGYVSEARKLALLQGAQAVVIPSLYEGFGLPAVEAMAVGVPLIASRTTALGEVVGDGGMTFDPADVTALAGALRTVMGSGALRQELSARGRERARAFSWERSARAHWEVYRAAAATRSR
jgi:glycosyltransferase involved in cell wall biosynthesis